MLVWEILQSREGEMKNQAHVLSNFQQATYTDEKSQLETSWRVQTFAALNSQNLFLLLGNATHLRAIWGQISALPGLPRAGRIWSATASFGPVFGPQLISKFRLRFLCVSPAHGGQLFVPFLPCHCGWEQPKRLHLEPQKENWIYLWQICKRSVGEKRAEFGTVWERYH